MKKRITVIGCSGFVGSHVAAAALKQNYSVVGTMRDINSANAEHLRAQFSSITPEPDSFTLMSASAFNTDSLSTAMDGSDGVIVCAGSPENKPETIELMTALANNVCDIALEKNIGKVVFTSSTGSTNPPEGEPELKNEIDHWSDDELQYEQKKYAAVGKTRLDKIVLEKMQSSNGKLLTATINPSMIGGPSYLGQPSTIHQFLAAVIGGKYMKDSIPNDSMSLIDARDLAALHLAALDNPQASGRYFGIKNSWHWRDILSEIERQHPGYQKPAIDSNEEIKTPTQFDLSRQKTLGVDLRELPEIIADSLEAAKTFGLIS